MSNIYVQEPPTSGKVVLKTTVGELEIELWSKECPKACRNFLQLCLDGYYNNTIFHNVVPNFMAQGGDPSGTGLGGESIYGEPFKNELHSRLRFVRRGLVATANSGNNDNVSQFFFTLGPTPELQNKHTIFGRVTGNSIFNMMKFNDVDTDKEGRPLYPPKLLKAEVILNPFQDVQPRSFVSKQIKPQKSEEVAALKGTKNLKLLSFAEEDESLDDIEDQKRTLIATKAKTSHDLVLDLQPSSSTAHQTKLAEPENQDLVTISSKSFVENNLKTNPNWSVASSQPQVDADVEEKCMEGVESNQQKLRQIRKEIKKVKRTLRDQDDEKNDIILVNSSSKTDPDRDNDVLKRFHQEQLKFAEKQRASIKKGDRREMDTLLRLENFRRKLEEANSTSKECSATTIMNPPTEESELWLGHKLRFEEETPALAKDANTKDDKWFDIYDPRNVLNKRRRQSSKQDKNKHPKLA